MIRRFGVAVFMLLSACQRDYPFHTVAVFEAPRGVALRGSQVHYGDDLLPEGTRPEPGAQVLARLLSDRGYAVNADELDELASATEGVLLGPKGTLMSGQSRCLRVVSTTFHR